MAKDPMDMTSLVKHSAPVDTSKPYDPSTLRGKNVLFTGGANGLGELIVRKWASHGANFAIGDIDDKAGERVVAELRTAYPEQTFLYQNCNVTDWDSQVAFFDAAVAGLPGGGLDIVVPNAGVLLGGASRRFEDPQLVNGKLRKPNTLTFEVNIVGVWYTTYLALYHLPLNPRPNADRCILLVGSLASFMCFTGQSAYAASKHAIMGLFRTLRGTASLQHNVRVNMICPYYINGTRLLPTQAEVVLLAGGAPGDTKVDDVLDAATRLVADESIVGRGLAIGPRIHEAPEGSVPVGDDENDGEGRAVWEVYAHDYEQADTWVWRYIHILNMLTFARGWTRWFQDAWKIYNRK